jgi:hypothetical protein
MTLVVLAALLFQQEPPTYAELSRTYGLGSADRLMREGKFLEAAVAYRNLLLQPGEREGVRIPLALALLAKGDAVYAGIEIRRAHMLYPGFSKLVLHPEDLFGAKGVLAKATDAVVHKEGEGDAEVNAVIAYALGLEGDRDRAKAALDRYAQLRGEDAFSKDLRASWAKAPADPAAHAAAAPAPAAPPSAPALRGGEPIRSGIRFIEPDVRPRGEIFSR